MLIKVIRNFQKTVEKQKNEIHLVKMEKLTIDEEKVSVLTQMLL